MNLPESILNEASRLMLDDKSYFDSKIIWFCISHVYFSEKWKKAMKDETEYKELKDTVKQIINDLVKKGILNEKKFGVRI